MIKEPENYEIYKLIFEIINPNQIRAISTDTRMVFLGDHLHADPLTLHIIKLIVRTLEIPSEEFHI